MRLALRLLIAAALVPSLFLGATAFNAAQSGGRVVTVDLVNDALAYLTLQANPSSPHACFVDASTGAAQISFGSSAGCGGTGSGVNPGDSASKRVRYAFHDMLKVTNKGTRDVVLWVNASPPGGSGQAIQVAKAATTGQMSDSDEDYYESSSTGIPLALGNSAYVGVRIKTGSVSSGSITGTVTVDARAS